MVLNKCITLPTKKREESSVPQKVLYSHEFIEDQCKEETSIHLLSSPLKSRRAHHENAPEDERNGEQIELDVVPLHGQENTAIADLEEEKNSSDDEGEEEEQGPGGTSSGK